MALMCGEIKANINFRAGQLCVGSDPGAVGLPQRILG